MSYTSDILNLPNLTIDNIVKIANKYLPKRYQQYPWTYPGLNHGEEVLETEELCNAYIVSYGIAHTRKLERAFDEYDFPFNQLSKGFELYDWGCGQGIGSITMISILKKKDCSTILRR